MFIGHTIRPGGSGGGILDIECVRLWLKSDSKIIASGKNSANAGGGSGGSIYIKCFKLDLDGNSKIINVGGKGEGDPYSKGTENGGHGRIRIDMPHKICNDKIIDKIKCDYTYFGEFKKK